VPACFAPATASGLATTGGVPPAAGLNPCPDNAGEAALYRFSNASAVFADAGQGFNPAAGGMPPVVANPDAVAAAQTTDEDN